jgi:S1-C subfamily serine protease
MLHKAFLLSFGLAALLLSAGIPAADGDWRLFVKSKTGKIYFDQASVRTDDDYVRFRYRVEFDKPRQTPNKKYEYSTAINAQAVRCDEEKYVVTSIVLFDKAGDPLATSSRKRDKWEEGLKEGKPGGVQERVIRHACKLAAAASGDMPEQKAQARRSRATVGAGIVATREGMIVTNDHVARGCSSITVVDFRKNRGSAELVAADTKNDLALIRADREFEEAAVFRKGVQLQAGESVTVMGYPLASILGSEPNVAFGHVSSTAGLRGDAASFQISAPIHKGNSGGPILDQSGNVTGVVSSKLNAMAVQKRTGDLPQNISFGVKAEMAQLFLDGQSVSYESGAREGNLENTEIAAIGRWITVLVLCRKNP